MLLKCCTQYASKFRKHSSGHKTGKCQFSFQSQRGAMPKNVQTTTQLHSSHVLAKQCWKFSKSAFNIMNQELPDVEAEFRKGRGTRDQIGSIHCIIEKVREFHKYIYLCFIGCAKAFDCVDHNKLWKILWEIRISAHLNLPPEKSVYIQKITVRTGHGKQTGSKLRNEYVKALYCHPPYLAYMQSTTCEKPGWIKHKLESRLPGEISIASNMQMTPPLWAESKEELKSLLVKMKEETEKAGWKLNIQKRSWHLVPSLPGCDLESKNIKSHSWTPNHCRWWLQPWN